VAALVVVATELIAGAAVADDQRFRLSNGMQVILQVDHARPRVAASLSYRVGQRDDPAGFGGLAHFVEHLMFEGSLHVAPGDHFALLERAGATTVSGRTGLDRTTFTSEVPKQVWRLPLWLESDRMAFLLARIDEAAVDKQRSIILNEAYERGQHLAWGTRWLEASRALFPESHPYYWDSGSGLDRIGLPEAQVFFQEYFGPNRATLALVGAFEPSQARKTIEQYFGRIQNSFEATAATLAPFTPLPEAVSVDRHAAVLHESVVVAWPAPAGFTDVAACLDVGAEYLRRSPAFRGVFDVGAGALTIDFVPHELGSVFWIEAIMREDDRADEVATVIAQELETLGRASVDLSNVALARQRQVARWSGLERDFASRADFLSMHGRSVEAEAVRYSKLKPDAILRALGSLASAKPLVMTTHFDPRVIGGAYTE